MIIINYIKSIVNDQKIFFTLNYDSADYEWCADIPLGVKAQEYLDANEDRYIKDILRKQYPDAKVIPLEDKSEKESFEVWIAEGCINPAIVTKDEEDKEIIVKEEKVLKKSAYTFEHPKEIVYIIDCEKATTNTAKIAVIEKMLGLK